MEIILKYFNDLSPGAREKIEGLIPLFREWNSKINLVSRQDVDHLSERHVLHSLSVAKLIRFKPGTSIIDVGTGGGFPGIPLAILFPECRFVLIDSIRKKIDVTKDIAIRLGIPNVTSIHARSTEVKDTFDFVIARAVTAIPDFILQTKHLVRKEGSNSLANGIIYIKGGDFTGELASLRCHYKIFNINTFFEEEFFETKKIIHLFELHR